MKKIFLSILWSVVRSLVGAGLGDLVLRTVEEATNLPDMSGEQRKTWVKAKIDDLGRLGYEAAMDIENSSSLINLAIEAAVQKVRG